MTEELHKLELYKNLTAYGTVLPTKFHMPNPVDFVDWTEKNFNYVRYNPRKDVNRYGLSITSLDGGVSGIPDLDSIPEYNRENNTRLHETDFNVPTPVYHYNTLERILDPIKDYVCRSHVLKLGSGGFFPPHRDYRKNIFNTFRLLIPLKNNNPPNSCFIVENTIINWEPGVMYFVDTAKMHYVFNGSFESTYLIVINVLLNNYTVDHVVSNLKYL